MVLHVVEETVDDDKPTAHLRAEIPRFLVSENKKISST